MLINEEDALRFIFDNDIKFIRLAFCDPFGTQKNISIMPTELERALTSGIAVNVSNIKGFGGAGEILLKPDLSAFSVLPWRPSHGRVGRFFCHLLNMDGSRFYGDCRTLLSETAVKAREVGLSVSVGIECPFYLFNTDELGNPTSIPFDNAGYLDIAPLDRGENVRREICLTLEEMSIAPEGSHHAAGPGQHVISYKYADPACAADNLLTYKWAVRTIAAKNGLYASFNSSPLDGKPANDCAVSILIMDNNLFDSGYDAAKKFAIGIGAHIAELAPFLTDDEPSFNRFIASPLPVIQGYRFTLPFCSPNFNPYITLSLLLNAGLSGDTRQYEPLQSRKAAVSLATQSDFIRESIPEKLVSFLTV